MDDDTKKALISALSKLSPPAVMEEGDFLDGDGLIVCGKCGMRKEKLLPGDTGGIKVRCICKCEQERMDKEKEDKAKQDAIDQARRLKDASLMDRKFADAVFDNCKVTEDNKKKLELCRKYADQFQTMLNRNQGLLFWGGVGTGKSYSAACIVNALIEKGFSAVMTSFVKLLEIINERDREEEIISRITAAQLVVFDDLGAERGTDYSIEKVYNFVDSRYRSGKPMIITTNLTLNEMFQTKDLRVKRIYDRIFEVCYPVQWTGRSWREITAQERFREMGKFLNEA
jgi:DNA replication protein DnaC